MKHGLLARLFRSADQAAGQRRKSMKHQQKTLSSSTSSSLKFLSCSYTSAEERVRLQRRRLILARKSLNIQQEKANTTKSERNQLKNSMRSCLKSRIQTGIHGQRKISRRKGKVKMRSHLARTRSDALRKTLRLRRLQRLICRMLTNDT